MTQILSPLQAQVVAWLVQPGDHVQRGDVLVVLEAMKMEHELRAEAGAQVAELFFEAGEAVEQGQALLRLAPLAADQDALPLPPASAAAAGDAARLDGLRPDLHTLLERQALTLDASRPAAMAKRHALGLRSARENIADLCDPGSFSEYGALAVAAQSARRSADDLVRNTPADGMVTGTATINAALFGTEKSRAVVLAYDATVLAGTQGMRNHQKTDRMLGVALQQRLPVVLFAEGGGGRPGDVDMPIVAGLHVPTFASFARLNGRVPVLGIVAGRCFAGNAALLGCSDVVIATRDSVGSPGTELEFAL